jgi:NADH-quinone oxidoreductase subunit N
MNVDYRELFHALQPELCLVLGALVVLAIDLALGRGRPAQTRAETAAVLGLAAIVAAFTAAATAQWDGRTFGGALFLDSLAMATRLGVLVLAGLTLSLLPGLVRLRHAPEYVAITLFATCGFTLMAAANNLLVAFLALELASLSLYILAGFDKTRPDSAEAGLKYFLFGGVSAAFLLFGFSLIYGLTGAIEFGAIAAQLARLPLSPLLVVALVMVLVAFGFKAAAAPFHLWAPDAYQGAPVWSAALIASASKLAGFTLFVRLLWTGVAPAAGDIGSLQGSPGWLPVLALLSAASLLLGNFAALAQTNVRRLLAYSAIAHAGALVLGVITARGTGGNAGPLYFYAVTYGLATIGAFGVIAAVEAADTRGAGRRRGGQRIADLAGLHRRSPLLTACLAICVLSLAGIPPLAGFFGKFAVFAAALRLHGLAGLPGWLALLAIAMSAVALYYYLLVLKQALVVKPADAAGRAPIAVPASTAAALAIIAVLLVALGLFPSVVLRML